MKDVLRELKGKKKKILLTFGVKDVDLREPAKEQKMKMNCPSGH